MPLNIDFQQIFLHLLNFTILFGALYFLLYSPVKNFMAKRTAYYEDMDNQARQRLEDADQVKADYEQKLESAGEEIRRRSEQAQQKKDAQYLPRGSHPACGHFQQGGGWRTTAYAYQKKTEK